MVKIIGININHLKIMKTKDVHINTVYLLNKDSAFDLVKVIKCIQGDEIKTPNMQSGNLFLNYHRKQRKFLLDNGMEVFAKDLTEIKL
jgi:hypothetical protein